METGHFDSESFSTSRFDTNSEAMKFRKKFDHFKKSFYLNKKNTLGEYFSFFKSSM